MPSGAALAAGAERREPMGRWVGCPNGRFKQPVGDLAYKIYQMHASGTVCKQTYLARVAPWTAIQAWQPLSARLAKGYASGLPTS